MKEKLILICQLIICCGIGCGLGQLFLYEWKKSKKQQTVVSAIEPAIMKIGKIKVYKVVNSRWVLQKP